VTVQLPEIARSDVETHMARGEIRLHKWLDGRGLMRGVTIEKYRGSSHDHRLRPLKITNEGLVIKMPVAESDEMEEQAAKDAPEAAAPVADKADPVRARNPASATAQREAPPAKTPESTDPPKTPTAQGGGTQ
jgi:hypothetical protein